MNKRSELIGACLLLLLIALPAQAGLGDLLGPIVNPPPVGGGGLGELVSQVVAPVTETVEVVVAPVTEIVTETVEVAAGTVIVPVIEVVGETIGTVEETTKILIEETVRKELPPVETPPIVAIDRSDLPETKPTLASVSVDSSDRPLAIQGGTTVSAPAAVRPDAVGPAPVVRALLTSLAATPEIQEASVLVESDPSPPQAVGTLDASWLSSLTNWLGAGISGLLDVLSIPMRLLELIFRALTSTGAGLLAPASLLLSLAVGGRRRPLTIA